MRQLPIHEVEKLIILAEQTRWVPAAGEDERPPEQINKETSFLTYMVENILTNNDWVALEEYALKADANEQINFVMSIVLDTPYREESDSGFPSPLFYDRASGFDIHNPYLSSCGRFVVSPHEAYPEFSDYLESITMQHHDKTTLTNPGIDLEKGSAGP